MATHDYLVILALVVPASVDASIEFVTVGSLNPHDIGI